MAETPPRNPKGRDEEGDEPMLQSPEQDADMGDIRIG